MDGAHGAAHPRRPRGVRQAHDPLEALCATALSGGRRALLGADPRIACHPQALGRLPDVADADGARVPPARRRAGRPLPQGHQLAEARQVRHRRARCLPPAARDVPGLLRQEPRLCGLAERAHCRVDEPVDNGGPLPALDALHGQRAPRVRWLPREGAALLHLLVAQPRRPLQVLCGLGDLGHAARRAEARPVPRRHLRAGPPQVLRRRAAPLPLHAARPHLVGTWPHEVRPLLGGAAPPRHVGV